MVGPAPRAGDRLKSLGRRFRRGRWMREGRAESVRTAEATRFFFAWRKYPWNSSNPQRDSFLRVALSAKAPRPTRICCHLQIVVKYYRLCGGEGGIRTLGTGYPVRQISNLVPSTTRPPLRARDREERLFNIDCWRASQRKSKELRGSVASK